MDEYVPLPRELEMDIWRNVKKLGSEIVKSVSYNIQNLASGSYWESEIIDTLGWITIDLVITSNRLVEFKLMLSDDGINFIESPYVYINPVPPGVPVHILQNVRMRYFKLRVDNISGYTANISIKATFRPYLMHEEIIPKRITIYRYSGLLPKNTIIQSPAIDTYLMDKVLFVIFPDRGNVIFTVEQSCDKRDWVTVYTDKYEPSAINRLELTPTLRFMRFSFYSTANTNLIFNAVLRYYI